MSNQTSTFNGSAVGHLFGRNVPITPAVTENHSYLGVISSQSPHRYVQQLSSETFVTHERVLVDAALPENSMLAEGHLISINYHQGKASVRVENSKPANTNDGLYSGPIVVATDANYYQRISPNQYISHDRQTLDRLWGSEVHKPAPELGDLKQAPTYLIRYGQGHVLVAERKTTSTERGQEK